MTGRKVPEWIGKTPDSKVPPRIRLRIFEREGGICYLSARKIQVGEPWELDHKIALCNGGENRESNLFPALRKEHKKKTRIDVREKAKSDRLRKKHLGITKAKSSLSNQKYKRCMDGSVVLRTTGERV